MASSFSSALPSAHSWVVVRVTSNWARSWGDRLKVIATTSSRHLVELEDLSKGLVDLIQDRQPVLQDLHLQEKGLEVRRVERASRLYLAVHPVLHLQGQEDLQGVVGAVGLVEEVLDLGPGTG